MGMNALTPAGPDGPQGSGSPESGSPRSGGYGAGPVSPARRGLLMAGLAAGAAAGTGAWRDAGRAAGRTGPPAARPSQPGIRQPGSLPYPHLPEGHDTIPLIRHIVVLMMENHSYDNRLGMLGRPGADGFTLGSNGLPTASNPYPDGRIQHAFRMPTTCQLSGQPAQDWADSHVQRDGGKLDGFVKSGSGPVSMGYWQQQDQPFYYWLASLFPIADRYFGSVLGQTFPNRRYLLAATSMGMVNDTIPSITQYPPNGTLFDALDAHHIQWRNYYVTTPSTLLYPELYLKNFGKKVVPLGRFFDDAANGTLPGFSLVDPDYSTHSEENPQNIAVGEAFAAEVVEAVMSGPAWATTLLIWVYDEHGGYYDHVPPPKAIPPDDIPPQVPPGQVYEGFGRYGFRVPCAVISPWSRRNYVSHNVFDHASICKLVETKWNLPAMTYRDANAHDMLDMLDLERPSFLRPPVPTPPLYTTDALALLCTLTGPGVIPPPGSITGG